ncbi:hypothetical protein LC092_05385 [Stappia stellulata]|uniref:hypothetical protein n=1 Tax=Stappia stellulata TaxID=71235 RepID=UPI001CD5BE26|nr:hypothetical protein [Stappia stellulata]MCA1241860.1 hypothetical protein [Stappia stellulata]
MVNIPLLVRLTGAADDKFITNGIKCSQEKYCHWFYFHAVALVPPPVFRQKSTAALNLFPRPDGRETEPAPDPNRPPLPRFRAPAADA